MYNEECVRHTTLYIILLVVFLVKFSNKRYLCFAKIGCGSVIQNERLLAFHFVLHSPCTIFAPLFKAVFFFGIPLSSPDDFVMMKRLNNDSTYL